MVEVTQGADDVRLTVFVRGRVQGVGTADAPVQLLDLAGRRVRTAPAGASTLDLAGVPAGVYLLQCGVQSARLAVE